MSSGTTNKKVNASGLTPEETRSLPSRQPNEDEKPALAALRDLYSCDPHESSYGVYASNAIFHDPVSIAEGLSRIKAQFNALPALFPQSKIEKFNLLETPSILGPKGMLIDQDVTYFREKSANAKPFKTLNSLLTIQRDNEGKILNHSEEWNHEPVTDSSNAGFIGLLNEGRKKAFAAASMPFVDQTPPADRT